MTQSLQREIDNYLSKKNPYYSNFSEELKKHLNTLYPELPIRGQWYLLKNNINELPQCEYPNCENPVKWNERKNQLDRGCCKTHNQKITFIDKFGTEHPNQNKQHFNKIQQKIKDQTGYSFGENPEIVEKRRKTNIKKYGVEEIGKAQSIRDKIKQTNLERYGVAETMSVPEIRAKAKKTMIDRYGVETSLSNPEIRAKGNKTNLKKYGSIFPMKNEELLEKRRNTIIEKYDAYSPIAKKEDEEKYYQLDKVMLSENNNERYFYFFDDEIKTKQQQIEWLRNENVIKNVYAITFETIDYQIRNKFINENSLYSNDSDIRQNFGIFSGDELVGVISGYEKSEFYEITRFVTKMGYDFDVNIIEEFIKYINITKQIIISFDRRFTSINQPKLEEIGFEFVGGTEPKLHKTEGFKDAWDCGKLVFKKV